MNQDEILAYIAGMMDGDGSFSITKKKPEADGRSILYSPLIQFGSVNKNSVELVKQFGEGSIFFRKPFEKDGISRREFFHWRLNGQDACCSFIEKILPYLEIKKERAEFLRDYLKKNPFIRGNNRIPQDILDSREVDYLKMKDFNDERSFNLSIRKRTSKLSQDKCFWAYLAGLLDTDGSFSLKKEKPRIKSPKYSPIVSLSMTDAKGINKIWKNCPYGTISLIKANACKLKSCYRWSLHSYREVSELLSFVIPYLRNKKAQAEILKEFCDNKKPVNVRSLGIPEEELEFRESCYQKIIMLNKYGVIKPSLIDLEAQEQGNKGEGEIHAERLNEKARKGCDSLITANSST